jgi:hypothetical protein
MRKMTALYGYRGQKVAEASKWVSLQTLVQVPQKDHQEPRGIWAKFCLQTGPMNWH